MYSSSKFFDNFPCGQQTYLIAQYIYTYVSSITNEVFLIQIEYIGVACIKNARPLALCYGQFSIVTVAGLLCSPDDR